MSDERHLDDTQRDPQWWRADGHVSDLALSVLSDEQSEIVPIDAQEHVTGCAECRARGGEMAFVGMLAHWAIAHPAAAEDGVSSAARAGELVAPGASRPTVEAPPAGPPVKRGRFPVATLVAALAIASLGALPRASEWLGTVPLLAVQWRDALAVAMRTAGMLTRQTAEWLGPMASWGPIVGAAVLLVIGIGVARALPRRKGDWA